jgi:heat shock protein HtpX
MKRIALFLATNIAIFIVLSITLRILGVDSLFMQGGALNITSLAIFATVFGMGGSFLSLAISKWSAKMMTGAQVITQPRNADEQWLMETVKRQAQKAGIGMPEVAIYDAPDMNAFATGMSRNNALVAVSTGLMHSMSRDEVEAVLAHEVSHVANGDMVTMALIQGVINTFVIFIARIIGSIVDRALSSNSDEEYTGPGIAYYVTSFIAEMIIAFLAQVIVMWFSRQREFRADAGSAALVGKEKMIAALQRLQQGHTEQLPGQIAAFGISGAKKEGFMALFLSHPPLEERIEALRRP